MILPMVRVQITGLKTDALATIHAVHQLGLIELDKTPSGPENGLQQLVPVAAQIQQQEQLGQLKALLDSLILALDLPKSRPDCTEIPRAEELLLQVQAQIDPLAAEVRALIARRDNLEADLATLPRYEETLRRLVPLVPAMAHRPETMSTVLLIPRKHQWLLDNVREMLEREHSLPITLVEENISETMRAMLIIAPRERSAEIAELIGQKDISQLQMPDELQGLAPDAAVAAARRRLAELPQQIAAVEAQLGELGSEWAGKLWAYRACVDDRLAELRALAMLGMTEYAFVLQGWTPERDLPAVEQRLAQEAGAAVVVERLPISPEGVGAPVALANPRPSRPFERLVGIFSWPAVGDLDPTLLMALFMPFFFGIILGDIGYGTILLALALLFLRRFKAPGAARDIAKTLAFGAVWAIFFGFLYGEFLGDLGEHWGLHPIWIGRFEARDVATLLVFSIVVGAVHVGLGLLLGLWHAWQQRSRSHLLERGGMLICMLALFLLVATAVNQLPPGLLTPSLALLIVGIVILGSSFGWMGLLLGPLEFIGLVGNILSYLRLAAVGLASVYVALVANRIAGGLGVAVVGVIVALLIHALNVALGGFSPTIHSMRLHYVEFFSKFYEGGGRPFQPFRTKLAPVSPE